MESRTPRRLWRYVAPALTITIVLLGSVAAVGARPGGSQAAESPRQACDPNYAGACVPVGAATVTCEDLLPATDILVVGQDLYGLDRGGAGRVACEASGADALPAAAATIPPAGDAAATLPDAGAPAPPEAAPMPEAAVAGAALEAAPELAKTGRTTVPLLVTALLLIATGGMLIGLGRTQPTWQAVPSRYDVRFTVEPRRR